MKKKNKAIIKIIIYIFGFFVYIISFGVMILLILNFERILDYFALILYFILLLWGIKILYKDCTEIWKKEYFQE